MVKRFIFIFSLLLSGNCYCWIPDTEVAYRMYDRCQYNQCIEYCTIYIEKEIDDRDKLHFYYMRSMCFYQIQEIDKYKSDIYSIDYLCHVDPHCQIEFIELNPPELLKFYHSLDRLSKCNRFEPPNNR